MRHSVRSRGFTLIELLVGTVVGSIVLLAISMTFISQAQQYQSHASRRAIQASSRQALSFMERRVRAAGYGVHPDRAVLAYDSYDVVSDSAVAGYPDAFVVHSRDPLFRRTVQSADTTRLVLTTPIAPPDPPLQRGQILLLLCAQASDYAFVTVSDFVDNANIIMLDQMAPTAAPNSPTAAPGGLFREHGLLNKPCFSSATVVKVNRFAFYVASFDTDGNPATQGSTPYLMMHQGLDMPTPLSPGGDGIIDANDSVPVAEGIEQLQVAYILNVFDATTQPLIRGVNEVPMMPATYYGEQWQAIDPGLTARNSALRSGDDFPYFWFFQDSTNAQTRQIDHSANIRQVRLTVVARSTVPDSQITGDNLITSAQGAPLADGTIPWRQLENLSAPVPEFRPEGGGYYRVILREAITAKNLQMNAQFPPVSFANPAGPGGG